MDCEKCGKQTFVIYINKEHYKLCGDCYDKEQSHKEKGSGKFEESWMDFFRRANIER